MNVGWREIQRGQLEATSSLNQVGLGRVCSGEVGLGRGGEDEEMNLRASYLTTVVTVRMGNRQLRAGVQGATVI